MTQYIADEAHFKEVIARVPKVKRSLWIGTADIKDLYVEERGLSKARYFEHFKGGKYKLIGFGKDSETLEEVVIYQALYGTGQIWVRPYDIFFSKVTLPDGTEVERFKEIPSLDAL